MAHRLCATSVQCVQPFQCSADYPDGTLTLILQSLINVAYQAFNSRFGIIDKVKPPVRYTFSVAFKTREPLGE